MPRTIRLHQSNDPTSQIFGFKHTAIVSPYDTGGKLSISKVHTQARSHWPIVGHKHETVMLYVLQGQIDFKTENKSQTLFSNDLLYLPKQVSCELNYQPGTEALLMYSPGWFQNVLHSLETIPNHDLQKEFEVWELLNFGLQVSSFPEGKQNPRVIRAAEGEKFWLAGDEYTIKIAGRESNNQFCIVHFLIPPGRGPIPHIHSFDDEFFHVLNGEVDFLAKDKAISGKPGDTAILPRGILHAFRNPSDKVAEFLTFVTPSGFDLFLQTVGMPAIPDRLPILPTPDEMSRLISTSPKFGVELHPEVNW